MYYLYGAIVIVILIIVYYVSNRSDTSQIEQFITGCWVAPDDFCDNAEIQSMMLVFGQPEDNSSSVKRPGYLVITPNMVATPVTLEYSRGAGSGDSHRRRFTARVSMEDGPDWGEEITISANMTAGSMEISGMRDGVDTVYARLYRQNDISALAKGDLGDGDTAVPNSD